MCASGRRRRSSPAIAASWAASRNENNVQTATASASRSGSESSSSGTSTPSGPMRSRNAMTIVERDERLRMLGAQPVEVRAVLPPQMEQMLEAGSGHERRACALAFEQARSSRSSCRARSARRRVRRRRPPQRARTPPAPELSAPSPSRARSPSSSTASVNVPPTSMPRIATPRLYFAPGRGNERSSRAGYLHVTRNLA